MNWWWIVTIDSDSGRRRITGPFISNYHAQIEADKLGIPYELVELDTRDKNRASSKIKAMNVMKTGDIKEAKRRSLFGKIKGLV